MRETTTLSGDFQISVPENIRTARGWVPGQRFAFVPKSAGVLLVPVPDRRQLFGLVKGVSPVDYRDPSDRT